MFETFSEYISSVKLVEAGSYDYVYNLQKVRIPIVKKIKDAFEKYFPSYNNFSFILSAVGIHIQIHEMEELLNDNKFKNITAVIRSQINDEQNRLDSYIEKFNEIEKREYSTIVENLDYDTVKLLLKEHDTDKIVNIMFKDKLDESNHIDMLIIDINSKIKKDWNKEDVEHFHSKYKKLIDDVGNVQPLLDEYFSMGSKTVGAVSGTRLSGSGKTVQELSEDDVIKTALRILQRGKPTKNYEFEILDRFYKLDMKMPFGKYVGVSLKTIWKENPKYMKWLFDQMLNKPKNELTPFDSYFIRFVGDNMA